MCYPEQKKQQRHGMFTTGFDLTEAESLQILNFIPTEPVEDSSLIEELHARMTEKQQEGLLEFLQNQEDDETAAAAEEWYQNTS
jgi:hypothetical protein